MRLLNGEEEEEIEDVEFVVENGNGADLLQEERKGKHPER